MHHKMQYTLNYFINCGDLLETFYGVLNELRDDFRV